MIDICGIVVTQGNAGEKSIFVAILDETDDFIRFEANAMGNEKPCLTSIQEAIEVIKWKN